MAEKINADILKAADFNLNKFEEYDIVGFGSGVYNGKLHKELSEILSKLSQQDDKKAFIFSTAGSKNYSQSILAEQCGHGLFQVKKIQCFSPMIF